MQPTKSDYIMGGIMANMLLLAMVMYFLTTLVGGMSDLWFKIPLFLAVAALLCGIGMSIVDGVKKEVQSQTPATEKGKSNGSRGVRKQTTRKASSKTPLEDRLREVVEQQPADGDVK